MKVRQNLFGLRLRTCRKSANFAFVIAIILLITTWSAAQVTCSLEGPVIGEGPAPSQGSAHLVMSESDARLLGIGWINSDHELCVLLASERTLRLEPVTDFFPKPACFGVASLPNAALMVPELFVTGEDYFSAHLSPVSPDLPEPRKDSARHELFPLYVSAALSYQGLCAFGGSGRLDTSVNLELEAGTTMVSVERLDGELEPRFVMRKAPALQGDWEILRLSDHPYFK